MLSGDPDPDQLAIVAGNKIIADANIGQAGNIVIVNASSGTVAFAALPSYMLTPDSATVNFVTANNAVSLFSYLVIPDDGAGNRRVLVNYVGNFG